MSVASLSLNKTDWMHTRNSQRVISINFIFLWIWNEIFTEQICCTLVNIWRCILTQEVRHSSNRVSKTGNDDQRLLLHICQQQTLVIYSSTLAWKHLNYWGSSSTLPELKHYTQYFISSFIPISKARAPSVDPASIYWECEEDRPVIQPRLLTRGESYFFPYCVPLIFVSRSSSAWTAGGDMDFDVLQFAKSRKTDNFVKKVVSVSQS